MSKEMVVSANAHETRVAILEEGQLCEIYVEREKEFALVGSIYKGRVTRVLPGMQSAFVDIGLDSDAFLYVSDFLQEIDEIDHDGEEHETGSRNRGEPEEAAGVAALPGETISAGGEKPGNGNSRDESTSNYSSQPFGREGRSRDFQRSDRDRRPYGRDRGRRGRHGRGGRDRSPGGYGRHGRELPQSKYASHRPYEPPEETPAQPYEGVVLPGESLSVVNRPSAAEPSETVAAAETHSAQPVREYEEQTKAGGESPVNEIEPQEGEGTAAGAAQPENPAETNQVPPEESQKGHAANWREPEAPFYQPRFSRGGRRFDRGRERGGRNFSRDRGENRRRDFERNDRGTPQGWITSLEPLPGESLAKAKVHESEHESAAEPAVSESEPASQSGVHLRETDAAESSTETVRNPEPARDERDAANVIAEDRHEADLTEEEASNLAEQVAEAQQEEAEREAVERAAAFGLLDPSESRLGGAVEEAENDEEVEGSEEILGSAEDGEEEETETGEMLSAEEVAEELPSMTENDAESIEEKEGEEIVHEELLAAAAAEDRASFAPAEARVRSDFRARMQRPMRRGGRERDRGRGRRPFHGHMRHRGQPRRNQLISELLKPGQEIIVQIAKEPLGKKGARITSHVALPGRFLVYMPTLDHTGVSRKIASAEERSRLRRLVTEEKGAASGGFIVRTAAASASPDEVRADVQFLTKTWMDIKGHSEQRKAPSLLHRDLNLVERILRDYLSEEYSSIWVDSEEEYTKILDFVSRFQPQLANRVKLFTKTTPIFEEFGIQQEIDKGLRPKVWLKSGGYIVINHTEALVAIDVNTGKFVGRGSTRLEDTIVRTNIEAVKEIVRQIRLRDLGGIIIIDFIDMEERRNREKVMAALEEALKADRAPSKVLRFNEFGLVAITRKRTKQALERTLCQPCPYCTGSGMVKSIPTLCYEIQTEARKMAPEIEAASLTLRVHPEIAKALKTRESALMDELEQVTHKSLIIQADPTLHWEQYDIY